MQLNSLGQLADQRADEIRGTAQIRHARASHRGPRNSVRHRAGWTLVQIGLRLAADSSDR